MQLKTGKIKPVGSLADEHGVKPAQAHGTPEVFTAGSEDVTHKNSPAGTIPSAGLAEKVKFNGVERSGLWWEGGPSEWTIDTLLVYISKEAWSSGVS